MYINVNSRHTSSIFSISQLICQLCFHIILCINLFSHKLKSTWSKSKSLVASKTVFLGDFRHFHRTFPMHFPNKMGIKTNGNKLQSTSGSGGLDSFSAEWTPSCKPCLAKLIKIKKQPCRCSESTQYVLRSNHKQADIKKVALISASLSAEPRS